MAKRVRVKSSKRKHAKMRNLPNNARRGASPRREMLKAFSKFKVLDPDKIIRPDPDMENTTMNHKRLTVEEAVARARKSTATTFSVPDGDVVFSIMAIRARARKEDNVSQFYAELLVEYYHYLDNGIQHELYGDVANETRFLEMQYRVLVGDIDAKVFEQLDAQIETHKKIGDSKVAQIDADEIMAARKEKEEKKTKSEDFLSPNLKSCLAAGITGAAVSVAFDFLFETEQTTTEMLIDAGISGGISAAVGYAASAAFDMDDPSTFASAGLGAAAGALAGSTYRAVMEQFGNSDARMSAEQLAIPVPAFGE